MQQLSHLFLALETSPIEVQPTLQKSSDKFILKSLWYLLAQFPDSCALLPPSCPRGLLTRSGAEPWAGYER